MRGTVLFAAAALLVAAMPTISADPVYTVVADHLHSPRGLTFGPGGRLYVAQAGEGDHSGRITELRNGSTRDVVTGLISVGDEGEFVGVSGLSALGNGTLYAMMSLSNAATGFPSGLGHLLKVTPAGQLNDVANVGDFQYQWTTDHYNLAPRDFPDANPYAVFATASGAYVTDAGANTLNFVHSNGQQDVLAYFPNNIIGDSTPTCIAKGPDGALYIGQLALVDSIVFGPSATVYRVDPSQVVPNDLGTILSVATPWATGLWPINGCAFGPDGSFYASELITEVFGGGDVVKIPFSNPTVHESLTGQTLSFPAGVAVGGDGAVYVSNRTAFVPEGQVLRLTAK